jgi:putative ABC transport system permease protein
VGATPAHLVATVLRESLARASVGLAAGLLLAGVITRLLSTMIHGITALDPWTYTVVAVSLLIVVVAASYIPARRASRTDPVSALRDS